MRYVLDASAVMAYLRDERGAYYVETLMAGPPAALAMHAINLLEVYYKLASYGGESVARGAVNDLVAFGVRIHENVDKQLRLRAGFFKMRYQFLSLADSVCIALGEQMRATVVTSDKPFANVKEEGVKIELIR